MSNLALSRFSNYGLDLYLSQIQISTMPGFETTKKYHCDGEIFEHSLKLKAYISIPVIFSPPNFSLEWAIAVVMRRRRREILEKALLVMLGF